MLYENNGKFIKCACATEAAISKHLQKKHIIYLQIKIYSIKYDCYMLLLWQDNLMYVTSADITAYHTGNITKDSNFKKIADIDIKLHFFEFITIDHLCQVPPFLAVVRPSPIACSVSCSSMTSAATSLTIIIAWATRYSCRSRPGSCSSTGSNYGDTTHIRSYMWGS